MISRFAGIVRPLHHIDALSGLVHLLTKTLTLEEYLCSSHLIHKKKFVISCLLPIQKVIGLKRNQEITNTAEAVHMFREKVNDA